MVRVVFTLALVAAVLSVALPAVEYAGVQRSDAAVRDAVDRLVAEARTLAAGSDAVPADANPARRAVTLRLPDGGFASAGVRSLEIAPPTSPGDAGADPDRSLDRADGSDDRFEGDPVDATQFVWRVAGGTRHAVRTDDVAIRPATGDRLRIGGGTTRLVLRLVAVGGDRVVRIDRRRTNASAVGPADKGPADASAGEP